MRLTLRTLLAYLDDTLEPSEIKQIGQKVAESDSARELIARIKNVTRRRRLTTPSDAGKGDTFDPNAVAGYLDNELSAEQVAEIEKICLESDVHLAEIAACHQILTLVLGEPVLVPPTAKERMYGLVKGREAIPFRKAPHVAEPHATESDDGDDALQSVLAFHRQHHSWKRWLVPIVGVLLFITLPVVLIAAVMQFSPPHDTRVAGNPDKTTKDKDAAKDGTAPKDNPKDGGEPPKDNAAKDNEPPKDNAVPKDAVADKDKPKKDNGDTVKPVPPVERPAEASKERVEVAVYAGATKAGAQSILVQQQRDQKTWKRAALNDPIFSSDKLVSLPGYASEVISKKAVRLQLWGTLPEFTQTSQNPLGLPFLFESAVVLHSNSKFDLELTLERGRVYISNAREAGPVHVRLRFDNPPLNQEIWDITLAEPGSEVGVDLFRHYTPKIDWKNSEEPRAELKFCLLQGKGGLRVEKEEWASLEMPGPAQFFWDNQGVGIEGPITLEKPLPVWSREVPATKLTNDLREALDVVSKRLSRDKPPNVLFNEVVSDDTSLLPQRYVSLCGLCTIDAIPNVLGVLENNDMARSFDRQAAILLLRHWLDRGDEYGKQLYDKGRKSGFLFGKTAKTNDSEIIFGLLHDFDESRRTQPATFETLAEYLTYDRTSIRELAYWHLIRLSVGVKTIPEYNAAWLPEQREAAAKRWKAMITNRELPPQILPPMPPK